MFINDFLGFYLNQKVYPDFWYAFEFVFTLSHGQNAVDYVFNINRHAFADNLKDTNLTSLRSVFDKIIHHGSIRSFVIDNVLLLSCNSACIRYKNDLAQRRKESANSEISRNKNSWARSCES